MKNNTEQQVSERETTQKNNVLIFTQLMMCSFFDVLLMKR